MPDITTVVVRTTERVVVYGEGLPYSDARVLAYLRTLLPTNGDLLTVASNTLARIAVGAAPAGSVPIWSGSAWSVGTLTVAVAWNDITGKPATFPPSSHTHVASEITDFNTAWTARLTAAGSGATTGNALIWGGSSWAPGAYAYANLSGIPSEFAPSAHTHTASEITDFSTAWTTRMTALGSGASVNDVLTWNGSVWAPAAPSGGGMTNPMTTEWDLIRGGASGTPTRLAVGRSFDALVVKADATMAYCPQTAGFGRMPGQYSLAISHGNGTPLMYGWTAAVTRTFSGSALNFREVPRLAGWALHSITTTTGANQWAGWVMPITQSSIVPAPYGSATAILRPDPTVNLAYAIGLMVGEPGHNTSASGPYLTASPSGFVMYGLRCRMATQSTWHLIMWNGTTFTETNTGVAVAINSTTSSTDGSTHGLVIGRDPSGVWWEIWNELTQPATLLGSGRTASNVPATFAGACTVSVGMGTTGASGAIAVNALGWSALTPGGPF